MKKGTKRQSNVTRVLTFFREGDPNEVAAVIMLLQREGIGIGPKPRAPRRPRLNGAPLANEVESHKERVAHALAQGE